MRLSAWLRGRSPVPSREQAQAAMDVLAAWFRANPDADGWTTGQKLPTGSIKATATLDDGFVLHLDVEFAGYDEPRVTWLPYVGDLR